jgi:PucR C-terminal helix-turn-helix domain
MGGVRASTNGADTGRGSSKAFETLRATSGAARATASRGDAAWDVLVDALLDEHRELATRIREAIQAQLSAYRPIPREALDIEVGLQLGQVLRSAGSGQTGLTDQERAELTEVGEERARQGVPVDDMLRAWRIGVEVVVGYAREVGGRLGVDDSHVLEFVQSALAWSDLAMVATTRAHRRVELTLAVAADEGHAKFVRGTLLGTIPTAELRIRAEVYGLDPAGEYVAVRARLGHDVPQRQFEQAVGLHDPKHDRRGLCALVDGEIAGFLSDAPPRDIDGIVGFGPPRPLGCLTESYRLAARALVTAEACGLRGAYDIGSLGLRPAVAMDADLGELLRTRYLEPLAGVSSAAELIATLRAYLACGMHVERTATRLFVHQNTVRYRIARFEELTGTSLGDTEVVLEVWWALELSTMHL